MKSVKIIQIYFTILLIACIGSSERNVCFSNIKSGRIYGGVRTVRDGSIICEYTNIPYAHKPARFERARLKSLHEIVNKRFRNPPRKCIQGTREFMSGQEDCLYLHIYSSWQKNGNKDLQPVFAYLHGGSFNVGSPGEDLKNFDTFLLKGVMFVTINYRLGLFGFAGSFDATIKPNLGLEDQRLALKWIQNNIVYFNGDPKQLTLAGWSAGGAAVTYHLYSDLSKGLFNKAIILSGTLLNPWAFNLGVEQCIQSLCDHLSINPCSKEKLQSIKTMNIIPYYLDDLHFYYFGVLYSCFLPTIDVNSGFILRQPYNLVLKKPVNDVPVLLGFTSLEENCDAEENNEFSMKNYVPLLKGSRVSELFNNMTNALRRIQGTELVTRVRRMADMKHGIVKFAEIYSQFATSPLYFYRFAASFNKNRTCALNEKGALHGDDMKFLFWNDTAGDTGHKKLHSQLVNLWTNFIKYGNPTTNKGNAKGGINWNRYATSNRTILHIDRKITNKSLKLSKTYLFWDSFLNCSQSADCLTFNVVLQ